MRYKSKLNYRNNLSFLSSFFFAKKKSPMAGSCCFHPRPRMGSVGVAKDIYLEKFGLDATIFSLLVGNLPLDFLWFEMQVV